MFNLHMYVFNLHIYMFKIFKLQILSEGDQSLPTVVILFIVSGKPLSYPNNHQNHHHLHNQSHWSLQGLPTLSSIT